MCLICSNTVALQIKTNWDFLPPTGQSLSSDNGYRLPNTPWITIGLSWSLRSKIPLILKIESPYCSCTEEIAASKDKGSSGSSYSKANESILEWAIIFGFATPTVEVTVAGLIEEAILGALISGIIAFIFTLLK